MGLRAGGEGPGGREGQNLQERVGRKSGKGPAGLRKAPVEPLAASHKLDDFGLKGLPLPSALPLPYFRPLPLPSPPPSLPLFFPSFHSPFPLPWPEGDMGRRRGQPGLGLTPCPHLALQTDCQGPEGLGELQALSPSSPQPPRGPRALPHLPICSLPSAPCEACCSLLMHPYWYLLFNALEKLSPESGVAQTPQERGFVCPLRLDTSSRWQLCLPQQRSWLGPGSVSPHGSPGVF